jgi:hypothetical protein
MGSNIYGVDKAICDEVQAKALEYFPGAPITFEPVCDPDGGRCDLWMDIHVVMDVDAALDIFNRFDNEYWIERQRDIEYRLSVDLRFDA